MLQPTRQEDGSVIPLVGPSWKLSRTPAAVRTGAPALGAHNAEILAEIGVGPGELAQLRADGVV
jgi:crotonobetainyl-CoA:carnitine CoA-transferase CaiB-like acyl-CoA transferase